MRRIFLLAVAWSVALFARAERIELSHGDVRCVIETQGARVVSYSVAGQELLWMPKDGLEYTIRLGAALELELKTINRSDFDFPMGVAFHPYFRVGERDRTTVEGVCSAAISVTNAVDRGQKFEGTELRKEYRIVDSSLGRTIRIVAENSTGVNVWNPGAEKNCPGIIPDDEWRRFVAVEPFSMGANRFHVLKPRECRGVKMSVVTFAAVGW